MNETMYNYKSGKIENNLPKKDLFINFLSSYDNGVFRYCTKLKSPG